MMGVWVFVLAVGAIWTGLACLVCLLLYASGENEARRRRESNQKLEQ
jgi:hypothetical protein